jgi:hypothetical protein
MASLVSEIEMAFADVRRGATTIHEAEILDRAFAAAHERELARAKDRETRWQEIPDDTIAECFDALAFLDPESWRYYLPAYMRWALVHLADEHHDAIDGVIYSLSSHGPDAIARYEVLSPEQSRAVCRFLRAMMDLPPGEVDGEAAQDGLDRYWSRFCDDPVA